MKENLLVREKQARILMALKDSSQEWYVSSLAKAAGTTYVHTCNFINECEHLGLTTGERHGKTKVVRLTSKGARISEMMESIYSLVNEQAKEEKPQADQPTKAVKPAQEMP